MLCWTSRSVRHRRFLPHLRGRKGATLPPSGEPVTYFRCRACCLLFTPHFDILSAAQLAARIYNAEYATADPDFAEARPRYLANLLRDVLEPAKDSIRALDFGGGQGLLARLMREAGFEGYASYDPFFGNSAPNSGGYDLITAFEVVEHSRDPIAPFQEMLALLRPDGAVLFSTALQPRCLDADWWYIAPRNGHVSLHSRGSLRHIARHLGVRLLSIDPTLHLFCRSPANLAARLIIRRHERPMLRFASLGGFGPLLTTAWEVARMGGVRAAIDPHHAGRALLRVLEHGAAEVIKVQSRSGAPAGRRIAAPYPRGTESRCPARLP